MTDPIKSFQYRQAKVFVVSRWKYVGKRGGVIDLRDTYFWVAWFAAIAVYATVNHWDLAGRATYYTLLVGSLAVAVFQAVKADRFWQRIDAIDKVSLEKSE